MARAVQDEIALRLDRGEKLVDVEAELIDSAVVLSDDERAALWLFAWSYQASDRPGVGQVLRGSHMSDRSRELDVLIRADLARHADT